MNRNPTKSGIISAQKQSPRTLIQLHATHNWWEWSQNFSSNRNANCDARWFNQFCVRGWKKFGSAEAQKWRLEIPANRFIARTRAVRTLGLFHLAVLFTPSQRHASTDTGSGWGCWWRKSLLWQFLRSFINFPDEASACWCARVAPLPPTHQPSFVLPLNYTNTDERKIKIILCLLLIIVAPFYDATYGDARWR